MRQFKTSTFSPDGTSGALASRQREVVADAVSTIASLAEASRRMVPPPAQEKHDFYDEGLVHDHGWARSSTH